MTLLIVDDDTLVAQSLQAILEASGEVTVLAVGNSGKEALSLYEQYKPDILLMDIRMDGMSGLEAGETILTQHPEARLLFLTTFSDDEYIIKELHIGAKGYLLKQDFKSILPALKAVMEGQTVFGGQNNRKTAGPDPASYQSRQFCFLWPYPQRICFDPAGGRWP